MNQNKNIIVEDMSQEFFQIWEADKPFTIDHLESYYLNYPDVFNDYFKSHCQRMPERLNAAIAKYPDKYDTMKRSANLLPSIIRDVYEQMSELMGCQMNVKCRILVGGFGLNAYVTHDGTLHFAVESLTDELEPLKVLVAHEMAHAYHFEMLRREGFEFSKLAWDGYTSLYLEGVAALVSEIINPGLSESVEESMNEN
ncbi:hypothetical protein [Peribacillus deserti]|uniref:Uncharacterized protein n=1 Tax=Peribacillus deserti TaxID=673318 RepID=A0A2N5M667_9BACI|nr:hypothetical protein [Peribacillus deserti]PLT29850.1 hypothetical protein CUU66_11150 [Peribacillus deserti]